jgi:hypothetical protein
MTMIQIINKVTPNTNVSIGIPINKNINLRNTLKLSTSFSLDKLLIS